MICLGYCIYLFLCWLLTEPATLQDSMLMDSITDTDTFLSALKIT